MADDLDDAASQKIRELRKNAEKNGFDVKGAESFGRKLQRTIEDIGDQIADLSPVKSKIDVSADHIHLSGSVRLPDLDSKKAASHEKLKNDIVFANVTRHELKVEGQSASIGFASGLIYGLVCRQLSVAPAMALMTGSFAATAGGAYLGSKKLDGEEQQIRNAGAAGLGYIAGMTTALGVKAVIGIK